MSSGPKNQTITTSAQPPDFLLPALTTATGAALQDFGRQGVAGARPQTGSFAGPSGIVGRIGQSFPRTDGSERFGGGFIPGDGSFRGIPRGGGGVGVDPGPVGGGPPIQTPPGSTSSGLLGQAGELTGQTLRGDFLTPESNPFLASTFNRAADLTRTRLASEFAGSGRNLDASQPARSDELQTLAAGIFGPNFQAERDRQIGAIGSAQQLDPINTLINRIAGITPGAGGITQSQQPIHRDPFGSLLGGLGLGFSLFSDRRLKRNIRHVGYVNGHKWYEFDYIWGRAAQGVMSDEIPQEFVSQVGGFDTVNYGALLDAGRT